MQELQKTRMQIFDSAGRWPWKTAPGHGNHRLVMQNPHRCQFM